jgi:N-acetylneuraminic acid mutarotase
MEVYCSKKNFWSVLPVSDVRLQGIRGHQSVLMPDGTILIIGGEIRNEKIKEMYRFDTKTNEISELQPMIEARSFFQAILSQNLRYIYCLGGLSSGKSLRSIERYDIFSQ